MPMMIDDDDHILFQEGGSIERGCVILVLFYNLE